MTPPDQEHLRVILSVALGQIPFKDLAPLSDRPYDSRKALQSELADYLTKSVIGHFRIEQRPPNYGGSPMSGMTTKAPDDLVGIDFQGWDREALNRPKTGT